MKRMFMWAVILIPIFYFSTKLVVCKKIDLFALRPAPVNLNHEYQFGFSATEKFLPNGKKDSLSFLYATAQDSTQGIVLYFHGNTGNLQLWSRVAKTYLSAGYDIALIDYPGFGKSTGPASEQGLYQSADALYEWAINKYQSQDIVLLGRSIGTVAASYLSSQRKAKKLILVTPFANMGYLIKKKFRIAPVCESLYKKYTVDAYISGSLNEVHVIRSGKDRLLPAASNEILRPICTSWTEIPEAAHGNIASFGLYKKTIGELLLN